MHESLKDFRAFFLPMNISKLDLDIYKEIVAGTKEVFSTMLMVDLQEQAPVYGENVAVDSKLTSMIGLGGEIKGMIAVHCPEKVAKDITGGFLGMEIECLDEDVKDAIGEIANMVAGNLKISFEKIGQDIQLAIPTSVIGNSYRLSGFSKAFCISIPFKMNDDTFWIDFKHIDKNAQ